MKVFLVILYIISVASQQTYYDRKYDYYDTDNLVTNPRLLKKYLDCFLNKGPCTPLGRSFKAILPEVVITACERCSPSQKSLARRTFSAFQKYHPDDYMQLVNNLDPQNKYFNRFWRTISGV